jgi:hypothetical protein
MLPSVYTGPRWQRGPVPRFPVGNSSTGDGGWGGFAPHREANEENSLPIESGRFGGVPLVPIPETRIPAPLVDTDVQNVECGCEGPSPTSSPTSREYICNQLTG